MKKLLLFFSTGVILLSVNPFVSVYSFEKWAGVYSLNNEKVIKVENTTSMESGHFGARSKGYLFCPTIIEGEIVTSENCSLKVSNPCQNAFCQSEICSVLKSPSQLIIDGTMNCVAGNKNSYFFLILHKDH